MHSLAFLRHVYPLLDADGEYGWYGTLKDLAPGQGYKLKTAIGGSATFDGK